MAESLKRKAEDELENPKSADAPASVFGAAIAKTTTGTSGFGGTSGGGGLFAAAVAKTDGNGSTTANSSGFGWGFGKDKKSTTDDTKASDTLSKARNVSVFSNVFQESTKSVFGAAPTGMFSTSTSTGSSVSRAPGEHTLSSFASPALGENKDNTGDKNGGKTAESSGASAFASVAASSGTSAFGSGSGRSSLFNTAAQPMFVSADKAKSEAGTGDGASATVAAVFDKSSEKPKSGEEDEIHVRTVQICKLYCFQESDTGNKGWQERGKGRLTLNKATSDSARCRLVMRQEANKRLCLNAPVWSGMCASQVTAKNIRFTAINHASDPCNADATLPRVWLLQSSKADEIGELFTELKRLEKLVQEHDKKHAPTSTTAKNGTPEQSDPTNNEVDAKGTADATDITTDGQTETTSPSTASTQQVATKDAVPVKD